MGSGKGKGRRIQAGTTTASKPQAANRPILVGTDASVGTGAGRGVGGGIATPEVPQDNVGELGRVIQEKAAEVLTWPAAEQPFSATPAPAKALAQDMELWRSFVKDSGIGSVKFLAYYLGKDALPDSDNYEKAIAALFADAVDVGAIVFPDGLSQDDFEFETKQSQYVYDQGISIKLRSKPDVPAEPLFNPSYIFSKSSTMGGYDAESGITRLITSLKALLSKTD